MSLGNTKSCGSSLVATTTKWFDLAVPGSRRFSIYLPSKQKNGLAIENFERVADTTLEILCSLFGGATSYPAKGVFQGADSSPQKEDIRMVECFCKVEDWEAHSQFLQGLVGILAKLLNQETIGCALDGQILFVDPVSWCSPNEVQLDADALKSLVYAMMEEQSESSAT